MKGIIIRAWSGLWISGGILSAVGCYPWYANVVDPCYPERYNYMARNETNEGFTAQVMNGHVLDQTVWNTQFDPGTSNLTAGGREHLVYLVRRRPRPDCVVYVQAAQDVVYDAAAPDRFVKAREALNRERVASVQRFLAAETAGTGLAFAVVVHNPADPGIPGVPANNAIRQWYMGAPGGIVPVGVGSAGTGAAGGSGAAGVGGTTSSF